MLKIMIFLVSLFVIMFGFFVLEENRTMTTNNKRFYVGWVLLACGCLLQVYSILLKP